MKKIAILGGSHFIGVHLLFALYQQGHYVTLYNRNLRTPPVPYPKDIEIIKGDRNNPEDLKRLFHKEFDVVFDLSGYTLKHVQPIALNYHSSIGHYLFCSTPTVYKIPTPNPYNEQAPRTFDENTYGGDKALVEELLFSQYKNNQWPITIFRPQGVFGPYDTWQAGFIYYRLMHSLPIFVYPENKCRMNPLFVDDFVTALLLAMENSISYGSVYGVAGDDIVSNLEFIELCGKVSSYKPNLHSKDIPISYENYETGRSWFEHDIVADCSKLKTELGVKFTSLDIALNKTFVWLKENPSHLHRYS